MPKITRIASITIVGCGFLLASFATVAIHCWTRRAATQHDGVEIQLETTPAASSIPVKVTFKLSREPRLGEIVRLIFELTPSEDIPEMTVEFDLLKGVEVVSAERLFHSSARKDECKEFAIELKFTSSPVTLGAEARGTAVTAEGERLPLRTACSLRRVIVDEETGQFGGIEELYRDPWWNFDALSGQKYRVSPAEAERNRKWIEEMRKLETSITDWEALYLCRDAILCSPESPEESLRLNEKKGWEEIPEKGRILLENKWLQEFRKSPRTDIRTLASDDPNIRRKLEEHLRWLKELRKHRG